MGVDRGTYRTNQCLLNCNFDFGPADAAGARQSLGGDPRGAIKAAAAFAKFPFLAANVVDATGNLPAYLRAYAVKDLGIAKVGVLGLTYPGSATIVKATSVAGLRFLSTISAPSTSVAEPEMM